MNKTVEDFIATYLHIEVAYDDLALTRQTIAAFSPEYGEELKQGFAALLQSRELSFGDYDGLTHIEFESDDALYTYLQGVNDFLFNGAETAPEPPRD